MMSLTMSVEHTRESSWVTVRKSGRARRIWMEWAVSLTKYVFNALDTILRVVYGRYASVLLLCRQLNTFIVGGWIELIDFDG
jgi:hypothetical protein